MTDFTPEHYKTAADICDLAPLLVGYEKAVMCARYNAAGVYKCRTPFGPEDRDYRALREALDKKGLTIFEDDDDHWRVVKFDYEWYDVPSEECIDAILQLEDLDPVALMMKIVVALVEAGAVE